MGRIRALLAAEIGLGYSRAAAKIEIRGVDDPILVYEVEKILALGGIEMRFLQRVFKAKAEKAKEPEYMRLQSFAWMLTREPRTPVPKLVRSGEPGAIDDGGLIDRIVETYRKSHADFERSSSMWDGTLFDLKCGIHNAILDGSSTAAEVLRDPASNVFFWGFDAVAMAPPGAIEPHENVLRMVFPEGDWSCAYAIWLMDALLNLAEALGARRLLYPEMEKSNIDAHYEGSSSPDAIISDIERVLEVKLRFPNPFPNELGLDTTRGVLGFRTIQAIYQAWRIKKMIGKDNGRVLEIGAGLGRTAYMANVLGIADYTIIDIPLTNVAQAYFLGRTLGDNFVSLYGEERESPITVLPPAALSDALGKFQLVVNIDSMTEMTLDAAQRYFDFAKNKSGRLLSINHEINPFTVASLYLSDPTVAVSRHPYWLRRGYVEEHLSWPG